MSRGASEGHLKTLKRLKTSPAYETLGVYLVPNGNTMAQVENLRIWPFNGQMPCIQEIFQKMKCGKLFLPQFGEHLLTPYQLVTSQMMILNPLYARS